MSADTSAIVVKIGGGLLAARGESGLSAACAEVRRLAADRPVLVVPGGGPFADAVRAVDGALELPDAVAHELALHAMDQFGRVLMRWLPGAGVVSTLTAPAELALLRCAPALAGRPEIPESWSVTSDSLAVFAAAAIGAPEVALLKPVPGIARPSVSGAAFERLTADELTALQSKGAGGEVDRYLSTAIRATGVAVVVRAPESAGTRIEAACPSRDERRATKEGHGHARSRGSHD